MPRSSAADDGWQDSHRVSPMASFRFGHSMGSPEYHSTIFDPRPEQHARKMPRRTIRQHAARLQLDRALSQLLRNRWVEPNFSRRIGPYLSDGLGQPRFFLPSTNRSRGPSLSRPVRRCDAGLWSVDCVDRGSGRRPHFINMSRLLATARLVSPIREWLLRAGPISPQPRTTRNTLHDPPLPFFVLFRHAAPDVKGHA